MELIWSFVHSICPTSASSEYCIVLPTTLLGAFPYFLNHFVAVIAGERGEIEIVDLIELYWAIVRICNPLSSSPLPPQNGPGSAQIVPHGPSPPQPIIPLSALDASVPAV